jgi:predicted dehydrogenase
MKNRKFTRRDFIRAGAGVTALGAAGKVTWLEPGELAARSRPVAPSDRVRFGIVGVGMQGVGLLRTSIQIPGVECAAACDLYDGRHELAREVAGENLPTTRRYQELLDNKEIDCIINATPDHWHRKILEDAVAAGKDVYCEKPMSHTIADGVAMAVAEKNSGRIVQVGSQRTSSQIVAKARELLARNILGEVSLIEGVMGRNEPTGAWQYPPPPDLSPENLDWDTWLGAAPKIPFNPIHYARWRCWKEYGTGVAGDLMVHLISGMMTALGVNEIPRRAQATGGNFRWPDGRNTPDVHTVLFDYGRIPVYVRLTLGTETEEVVRFFGAKGVLEMLPTSVTYFPQAGIDQSPSYYANSFPKRLRDEYFQKWREENAERVKEIVSETEAAETFKGPGYDNTRPHLEGFFEAVRTRETVFQNATFGHHAAAACHLANEAFWRGSPVMWDAASQTIKS